MNDDECRADFRVSLSQLSILDVALRIPGKFTCPNGTVATGYYGKFVHHSTIFAYPRRFSDMMYRFGRPVTELSLIASGRGY